jgi:hypothetical protein
VADKTNEQGILGQRLNKMGTEAPWAMNDVFLHCKKAMPEILMDVTAYRVEPYQNGMTIQVPAIVTDTSTD